MESSCQIDFSATENTIRQDIQATLTHELNKLMKGSSLEQQGFQKLFSQFISLDKQENVVWEETERICFKRSRKKICAYECLVTTAL